MIHATKGVVLRTVKYGDTSVITSIYTELFGIQQYIVKGVRQTTKKSAGKAGYFQPGAILDLEVYHNELKQLQFIKEFKWSYIYEAIFFDVVKNTVAMYIIELLQHSLKQPEANPELFYLIEDSLKQLDKGTPLFTGNLPLYFTLHLAAELGFQLQGVYSMDTTFIDWQEGCFVKEQPVHPYYADNQLAAITSRIANLSFYNELETIALNQHTRRQLLEAYQTFLALHIPGFGEMKSYAILQELLR
jgi:DNA repair protein RecO (recombination protein O)